MIDRFIESGDGLDIIQPIESPKKPADDAAYYETHGMAGDTETQQDSSNA